MELYKMKQLPHEIGPLSPNWYGILHTMEIMVIFYLPLTRKANFMFPCLDKESIWQNKLLSMSLTHKKPWIWPCNVF